MDGIATPRWTYGQAVPRNQIPLVEVDEFRATILDQVAEGGRVIALFGQPAERDLVRLLAVLAFADSNRLSLFSTTVRDSHPALTPHCPQVHWFEREIAEQWGVTPVGHPWLKPIRFHHAYRPGRDVWDRAEGSVIEPCVTDYFRVEGEEVYEVAVGPVHAGVIEPGHFRFQGHGERVFHLEISLGYQHRGIERALVGGPNKRTIHYMEAAAGDTSIGHATAYCQALEMLSECSLPPRAQALRGIALELERLANHTGDLGALANDVAFLSTNSYCGRLRGDYLNASALMCVSRFGRTMVRPGGVAWDIDPLRAETMHNRLVTALAETKGATEVLWNSLSVQSRFEGTGTVSRETAEALGMVGVAARACGVVRDARQDFPSGIYRFALIPVSTWNTGDVFARAYVRYLEVGRSGKFLLEQLGMLPAGPTRIPIGPIMPDAVAVSMVEGWRGGICHVAVTDAQGQFERYKIVDPSFHNWIGLSMALRNQEISDFPLCNKSFNLSYCGHDL
jgi:Ni,Fe-hydrogenase III large subunit